MDIIRKRVSELNDELTVWDGPWAGSFAELRRDDGLMSSGYNQPQDGDAREFELLPEE